MERQTKQTSLQRSSPPQKPFKLSTLRTLLQPLQSLFPRLHPHPHPHPHLHLYRPSLCVASRRVSLPFSALPLLTSFSPQKPTRPPVTYVFTRLSLSFLFPAKAIHAFSSIPSQGATVSSQLPLSNAHQAPDTPAISEPLQGSLVSEPSEVCLFLLLLVLHTRSIHDSPARTLGQTCSCVANSTSNR